MNNYIIIEGVGSFLRSFVQSMSKEAWIDYMKKVNPLFTQAEDVWLQANSQPKSNTSKKKKEDVPDSNDQL